MNHWVTTEEIKVATRKARRAEARKLELQGKTGGGEASAIVSLS